MTKATIPWTLMWSGTEAALFLPALTERAPVRSRLIIIGDRAELEHLDGSGEMLWSWRLSEGNPGEIANHMPTAGRMGSLLIVEERDGKPLHVYAAAVCALPESEDA